MQQTLIVHKERISRSGEMKYFQIPLSGTLKKVIGVETSIFLLTPLPALPDSSGGSTSGSTPTQQCPNPGNATLIETGNVDNGLLRTQNFQIGAAVNPGFKYSVAVYGVTIVVTAVDGDTPAAIAQKLYDAINNTTLVEWSVNGSNTHNFKPFATYNQDTFSITVASPHSFASWAEGSCTGVSSFDPLFTIGKNEKAGVLSLQSPDATDIFFQSEVFRQDSNISFGDFTTKFFPERDQWICGEKRVAIDVMITTSSPIIEAYYKDFWGALRGMEISYILNIFLWLEKK